jgi:hypothetical protein
MSGQVVEVAWDSLCKHGEELCGDWVKVTTTPDDLIVVLSDGLGSGVKANILATLTTEIASTMLVRGASIDDVVETLAETLPECQVRHLAYATFAVLRVVHGRDAYLVEYDSPPMILVRHDQVVELPMTEREVAGRKLREGRFTLDHGDYMVMLSDGYIHAGVGGLYRMGWGWKNVSISVQRWTSTRGDAYELVGALNRTCKKLSNGEPGDDSTAVAMRVRSRRKATILTGPPANADRDGEAVSRLMAAEGLKAICGGTTAQMAARVLGKELKVEWRQRGANPRAELPHRLPPVARLDGVDLVTEGVLTLSWATDCLQKVQTVHDLPAEQDSATRLARMLLEADEIHFIVGDAINPQQLADVVRGKPMRQIYLEELINQLTKRNKQVTVEHL